MISSTYHTRPSADDTIKQKVQIFSKQKNYRIKHNPLTSGELLSNDQRAVGFVSSKPSSSEASFSLIEGRETSGGACAGGLMRGKSGEGGWGATVGSGGELCFRAIKYVSK